MNLSYNAFDSVCSITLSIRTEKGDSAYAHLRNFTVKGNPNASSLIGFETCERKFITNFYKLLFSPSGREDGVSCEARVYFKHMPKDYIRIRFTIYNQDDKTHIFIYNDHRDINGNKCYDGVQISVPETYANADNNFGKSITIDYVSAEGQSATDNNPPISAAE